jgi:group II intron reverse transcriptase/maturase
LEESHKTLQRLERLRRLNSNPEWINDDLYRLMFKEDLYIVAYEKIKSKPGNLTPGSDRQTIDGFSLEVILKIIQEMRTEQFQFKPVRISYIPKQNGKKRKLGISSARDKLVQEVMRMIFEAIYDSPYGAYFKKDSHGFRPGRSCHTALKEIRGKWSAANYLIEGDVQTCFDSIDHFILVKQLRRKIKDERFLNLVWKLLRAGYLDLYQSHQSLAGTPQGNLASPILANVYLHALDEKVLELQAREQKGKKKRLNPLYRKLQNRKLLLKKQGQGKGQECRSLIKQLRKIPIVKVDDDEFIRLKYSRFADDWLIGLSGPYRLAQQIKEELRDFLKTELKLTLSEEKTHITPGRSGKAHYLGTTLAIGRGGEAKQVWTTNGSGKYFKRRSTGWEVVMEAPIADLIKRLAAKGFCSALGAPTTKKAWIYLDAHQTVSLFASINRGIQNYYRFADNFGQLGKIQYILRFSLARTLAAKFKISVKKVLRRYGPDLTIKVKAEDGKRDREVSFYHNHDWQQQRNGFMIKEQNIDLLRTSIRLRSRSKLGKPCYICGSHQGIEMHHVRHIRKMDAKKATGFKAVMNGLNRKQIPTCQECHHKIHRGEYDGLRLSDLSIKAI